jgi:NAD(P)H-hydrate epimerase
MERAAFALFKWFEKSIERSYKILIFVGPGNNGGDGLALARHLLLNRYDVEVIMVNCNTNRSSDWEINFDRLQNLDQVSVVELKKIGNFPPLNQESIVVDALLGTGLTRTVEGLLSEVIWKINSSGCRVISVDIPTGLFSEDNSSNPGDSIVRANTTLSFQFPKISFLFPENEIYTGAFEILPIGLHQSIIDGEPTRFYMTDRLYLNNILYKRGRFDHKGRFGHGLVVAGSCGKAGAAILASRAAMRTGSGLITAHVSKPVGDLIHAAIPEVMVQCDQSDVMISEVYNLNLYNAICIGPGIGTKPNTVKAVSTLLENWDGALIVDADAINIISGNRELLSAFPAGAILTPHPGEFSRLAGDFDDSYSRLIVQSELATQTNAIIVLKGAFTSIAFPGGDVWFNPTGNPGMATAGSGDVLSGIILSLLAQGYTSAQSAIAGVYIHGLAGDIAAEKIGVESLIASDIIDNIGNAFNYIRNNRLV